MPSQGARRLQFALGKPYFAAPLLAPERYAWHALRDQLKTNKPSKPQNWQLGGSVSYALSFFDKQHNKETDPGPWSEEMSSEYYVFPILTDIAWDPSGTASERRLYRRFTDANGKQDPAERVSIAGLDSNKSIRSVVDGHS